MLRTNASAQIKVLAVDSDPYLTDLFDYALGRGGYKVKVAHSAAEALQVAEILLPDIVLLSANLPDVGGAPVCTWIRKTLSIPVLMLIPVGTCAEMAAAREAGADDCLTMPFKLEFLSYRIRATLCRGDGSRGLEGSQRIHEYPGWGTFRPAGNQGCLTRLWIA